MVSSVVFLVLMVVGVYSLPQIIIPDLEVSPPEEINSLSQNRFRSRSIDVSPKKTQNNNNNFDDTIKEVEDILKTNPALPRLTRGEILDLLENITQTDLVKSQLLKNGKIERDPKAIMVVMPFTPSNDNNMQDLYTKPPVTHIIGGEPFTKPASNKTSFKRRTTTTSTTTEKPRRFSTKKPFVPRGIEKKQRQKQEYTTTTTSSSTTRISTSTSPPTFRSRTRGTPMRRRRPTSTKPTIKYNNHRYPEENQEFLNQEDSNPGFHVVKPPNLSEPDMEVQEDTKSENVYSGESKLPHFFVTPSTDSPPIYHGTSPKKPLPTAFSIITTTQKPREFEIVTAPASVEDLNIPPHLSGVVKDMNLGAAMSGNIPTIKPMPDFKVPDDTEKIKAMLESLGIYTPTTTTGLPDVKYMADNLSPDMKDLLMNFGLIPNPNEKPAVKIPEPNPEKAEISPDSFVGFKPLPEDSASRSEMEELLASFGLGRSSRREKSMSEPKTKKSEEEELSFEAVPEEYRGLLKDIGLRQGRRIRTGEVEKQHIFNPTDSKYASEEELGKLGKLIDMIKELEKLNRTVTDEDLKKLDLETLKELLSSLNQSEGPTPLNEQNPGPNPVDFDFGLSKNEVKRQQSTTEKVEVVESTNVQVVEEEERKPSIKDLEESFGGETTTTTTTEPPSTTRRTGFYYLVDWNTFLDIDDQKGKRVNLRFQPKIGDPKRFYSVTVP